MFPKPKRPVLLAIATLLVTLAAQAEALPNFTPTGQYQEQVLTLHFEPGVTATVVASPIPAYHPNLPTTLILFALPNTSSTAETMGHAIAPGESPRLDSQQIAAQTRLLRAAMPTRNLVIAYLETAQKSWPAWRAANKDNAPRIQAIVAALRATLPGAPPDVVLTGHSGGGSFTFGFLNGLDAIPAFVTRIAFLDSDYSFGDDPGHGPKLLAWLHGNPDRRLLVIAYDDRNIEIDGKKVISDTGGTYRATHRIITAFTPDLPLTEGVVGSYASFTAPQVQLLIHQNPDNKILHVQLIGEFNAFIRAMSDLRPGPHETWEKPLASLEGPRAYTGWLERPAPATEGRVTATTIPPRPVAAPGGTAFLQSLAGLKPEAREKAILQQLKSGNIPSFLRTLVPVTVTVGTHTAVYQVMPDYLAIGSDQDFARIPMNPHTAQAFCDAFGFALPTTKMVDDIWLQANSKLIPQPLTQDRESATTFLAHSHLIDEQLTGQYPSDLRAGNKKDVVLTNRLAEKPNRVAIYGWHFPGGDPIQPLTTVHGDLYVDYSHGIRLIQQTIQIDGIPTPYAEVLRDPTLSGLLSKEGPIARGTY